MNFAPGAWRYALPPFVMAPFALLIGALPAATFAALGAAVLAFFRDPERTPPMSGAVAPADGTVSVLRTEEDRVRLGTFMNVWHVHVVRSPFDATVLDVEHVPGAYKPAFSKASDRNERVHLTLEIDSPEQFLEDEETETPDDEDAEAPEDENSETPDDEVTVTFIAGAFARRIFPYVEPGDRIERGERLGHIAFGSRVDVLFPAGVSFDDIAVRPGESMRAGETVVLPASGDGAEWIALESDA